MTPPALVPADLEKGEKMAQKVQVVLTCDVHADEVAAAETVAFGFDGSSYAFELCAEHLAEFNDTMHGYVASARLADGPRPRRVVPAATGGRTTGSVASSDVRSWAKENGYEVNDRGRIPAEIRSAFEAAQ
jgi:hypothetical protein